MKITRDNYEVFFLDYLEGNLQEPDMDQFLDFLEQNTDLKDELRSFERISLPDETTVMPGKENLYKTIEEGKEAAGNKFVAFLEGDLDEAERKRFESHLAEHPEQQKEYALFEKTRLKPDPAIHFANKRKLYKKPASVVAMNWAARAAAVLVLAWGISLFFRNQQSPRTILSTPEIAQVTPKPEVQKKVAEPEKKTAGTEVQEQKNTKLVPFPEKRKPVEKKIVPEKHPQSLDGAVPVDQEFLAMTEIRPLGAQLSTQQPGISLAFAQNSKAESGGEPSKEMDIQEFLADRAKRVGNEGVRSFQRIARLGLGLASEISGDRINYSEKDGKISSVGFESRLLAFTIPLEKK